MRHSIWLKGLLAFGLVAAVVAAQETAPTASQRGRLPAYVKDVIEPGQRERIYEIQKKYEAEIDALESQILALEAKRDAEVDAVLTPAQKAKLARIKAFWEKERELEKQDAQKATDEVTGADEKAAAETP